MKNWFTKAFIPSAENDYAPDLLQKGALVVMLALAVLTFTTSNIYALFWQQSAWLVGAVLPAVIVSETNVERDEAHLLPLVRSSILDEAARQKAEDMAANSYFAHYSPAGVSPWHWFANVDYSFVHAGENLAVHFTDSKEVVDAWMNSPTHRANIVNGNYREIGVGTARGTYEGYDTVFVVQLFGTPAVAETAAADSGLPAIAVSPEPAVEPAIEPDLAVAIEPDLPTQVAGIDSDTVKTEEPDMMTDSQLNQPTEPIESTNEPVMVTEVVDRGGTMVVYSDTIATTTNLTAAPIGVNETKSTPAETAFAVATSPSTLLQRVYEGLGFITIVVLICSIAIEWRKHRPRQVVYGVLLLCLMSSLFFVHGLVTGGSLII